MIPTIAQALRETCVGPTNCGRLPKDGDTRLCIGPLCVMGWRFLNKRPTIEEADDLRRGYCGLAGKP